MRVSVCLCVVLVITLADARRSGGGGSRRGGSSSTSHRHRTSPPPPKVDTSSSNHFLNSERGSSSNSGTTHNRGSPPHTQPAPQPPPHPQTNGPIGFERIGGGTNQGNQKIGFDKVNSEVQNKPGGSHVPSAPPYPGGSAPNGPPPAYYPGTHTGNSYSGSNDHPPPYPGRPVNAPPSYQPNNPQFGQTNAPQPGFGNINPGQHNQYQGQNYPGQQHNPYPGQSYPGQQHNPYPGQSYPGQQHNPYPGQSYPGQQHNPYPGQNYPGQQNFGNNFGNTYPQQNQFGNIGHGSYPTFGGSSYPGNTGYHPSYGSHTFGGGSSYGSSYPGNTFGGSPFGNTGYNGNPYYSPNNFGYSNNPGYFGSHGYSGYPGQYDNYHKQSRFGGLPIPIPIPIPIPYGGGGFGSGLGGYGSHSYNHRLLDTFVRNKKAPTSSNSSTSVFILNNSTVAPCTTDHFVYDLLKVTVEACTVEHCTAVKISTIANVSNIVSVHSAALTMCLENNATFSYHGDLISPTVSELQHENRTVCRDVPNNVTAKMTNETTKADEVTTAASAGVETTTIEITTTETPTTEGTTQSSTLQNSTAVNTTRVCESVNCSWVEMCMPFVEIVDQCTGTCPFRRTGYKPCVTIKMCRSPSTPVSTFASLNTTISKIDEYNHHNSVFDAANLTLISYHRPVINFNCSQNATAPGCATPANNPPQQACLPANSSLPITDGASSQPTNSTLCVPPLTLSTNTTVEPVTTDGPSTTPPPP